jgi:hypothetical protein
MYVLHFLGIFGGIAKWCRGVVQVARFVVFELEGIISIFWFNKHLWLLVLIDEHVSCNCKCVCTRSSHVCVVAVQSQTLDFLLEPAT